MNVVLLGMIGVLLTVGIYLLLDDDLLRAVMGFALVGHAINVVILTTSVRVVPGVEASADPTAQAFVLTAVVISTAVLSLLAGAAARREEDQEDETE